MQMGTLKDKEAASKFSKKQKELNSLPAIDYEAVNPDKMGVFQLTIPAGRRKGFGLQRFQRLL